MTGVGKTSSISFHRHTALGVRTLPAVEKKSAVENSSAGVTYLCVNYGVFSAVYPVTIFVCYSCPPFKRARFSSTNCIRAFCCVPRHNFRCCSRPLFKRARYISRTASGDALGFVSRALNKKRLQESNTTAQSFELSTKRKHPHVVISAVPSFVSRTQRSTLRQMLPKTPLVRKKTADNWIHYHRNLRQNRFPS